ncbi:MAG: hypothetical protein EOO28_20405 [Comamonadaceae bacterium]|nr:MAG: hypothetical protein EOO28_20405 [Comamonadaceae bacterium]
MSSISRVNFHPGQVVATWRLIYWHVGIVTEKWEDGEQVVISCSGARKMVVEERMGIFSLGLPIVEKQFASHLPVSTVLARAREKLGKSYRLLDWNCEHFVCYAFDVPPSSPQLALAVAFLIGVFLIRN